MKNVQPRCRDAACCVRQRFCRAKIPLFMCLRHYYWNILRADAACCVPTASTWLFWHTLAFFVIVSPHILVFRAYIKYAPTTNHFLKWTQDRGFAFAQLHTVQKLQEFRQQSEITSLSQSYSYQRYLLTICLKTGISDTEANSSIHARNLMMSAPKML